MTSITDVAMDNLKNKQTLREFLAEFIGTFMIIVSFISTSRDIHPSCLSQLFVTSSCTMYFIFTPSL